MLSEIVKIPQRHYMFQFLDNQNI